MFNQFKEIEDFFKNDYFTEEELQELKKKIIDTYSDKEAVKAAFSQIDLNVVKFKLTPKSETLKGQNVTKPSYQTKGNKKKKESNNKLGLFPAQRRHNKERRAKLICSSRTQSRMVIKSKKEICEESGVSIDILKKLINENGVKFSKSKYFTTPEFNVIKKLYYSKKNEKDRQSNAERDYTFQGSFRFGKSSSEGIYDEIEKYGGVGKLIYIRSK